MGVAQEAKTKCCRGMVRVPGPFRGAALRACPGWEAGASDVARFNHSQPLTPCLAHVPGQTAPGSQIGESQSLQPATVPHAQSPRFAINGGRPWTGSCSIT
jgi:hypothetical protein